MTQNSNAMKRTREEDVAVDAPSCRETEKTKVTDVLHETKQEMFQRLLEELEAAEAKLAEVEEGYFSPESVAQRGGCDVVSGYNTLLRPLLPSSFFSSGFIAPTAFLSLFHEHGEDFTDIGHCIFSLSSCSSPASIQLQESLVQPEQNQGSSGADQEHLEGCPSVPQPLEQLTPIKQEHPPQSENDPVSSSPSHISLPPPQE